MKRADRAKQFMPFAALKGYEEALREKERLREKRREIGEDEAEVLDRKLRRLTVGDEVKIKHYLQRRYIDTRGKVEKLSQVNHRIKLDNNIEIRYEDIVEIEIV